MSDYEFGTIDNEMDQFQIVMEHIAAIEKQIDKIDSVIETTAAFVEKIQAEISPIIEKLSNNVFLKGFLS